MTAAVMHWQTWLRCILQGSMHGRVPTWLAAVVEAYQLHSLTLACSCGIHSPSTPPPCVCAPAATCCTGMHVFVLPRRVSCPPMLLAACLQGKVPCRTSRT